MPKAIIVKTDGTMTVRQLDTYDDINKALGGYIEAVRFGRFGTAYVNEEGKLLGLPRNEIATQLCFRFNVGLALDDFIVGDFVIFGPENEDGEDTDVPQILIEALSLSIECND